MSVLDGEDLTVDALTCAWTIAQRRRGHRHSTDDLLTGWYAAEKCVDPARILDLGAGIGTVGLLALWRSPRATLTSVEAQELSFALLAKNIEKNGLRDRVRAIHGDLRHVHFEGETFDLVTGSPPYFDPGAGVIPSDSQKAHARFELRGDVSDYCVAARAALARGGRFVLCFPTVQIVRVIDGANAAGLAVRTRRDVVPREGVAPLFSLLCCAHAGEGDDALVHEPDHVVRNVDGSESAAHASARATFGFAPGAQGIRPMSVLSPG